MGILSIRLGSEDEKKLEQVLASIQIDKSTLVRNLITNQWLSLKAGNSFVQRRGGHPSNLLKGSATGSSRSKRKANVGSYIKSKASLRKRPI
jgi:hypothetical protein